MKNEKIKMIIKNNDVIFRSEKGKVGFLDKNSYSLKDHLIELYEDNIINNIELIFDDYIIKDFKKVFFVKPVLYSHNNGWRIIEKIPFGCLIPEYESIKKVIVYKDQHLLVKRFFTKQLSENILFENKDNSIVKVEYYTHMYNINKDNGVLKLRNTCEVRYKDKAIEVNDFLMNQVYG